MGWLLALVAISHQAQTGRIQVSSVDPAGIHVHAQIQILNPDSGEIVVTGEASKDRGLYLSPPLPAGRYQVRAKLSGFRTKIFNGIVVEPDRIHEIPQIGMKIQSCDSPGMNCDTFGLVPPQKREAWDETLRVGCLIDLDRKSKKKCATEETADLRVEVHDQKLYFIAAGGARFSEVNPASPDGPFLTDRVRVDNLGSGFDICVKTKRGKVLTIFFTAEVPSGETKIPVYFVARS